MNAQYSTIADYDSWLALVREVEPLFGPMVDEISFRSALKRAIKEKNAFCVYSDNGEGIPGVAGGIIISKDANEILWFAVSQKCRSKGYGSMLLSFALNQLDCVKDILVQTFDGCVPEGEAARKLYFRFGFCDYEKSGDNPAGYPTVKMILPGTGK